MLCDQGKPTKSLPLKKVIFYSCKNTKHIYNKTLSRSQHMIFFPLKAESQNFLDPVLTLEKNKIQNYTPRILRNTNLYTRTKRCYWLESKIFIQPEFRNLSTSIKQLIEYIQIQTGSLVLLFLQVFLSLMIHITSKQSKSLSIPTYFHPCN